MLLLLKGHMPTYYTTKAVRGPIITINQSDRSVTGLILSKYRVGAGIVPNDPVFGYRFQLEIKMADDGLTTWQKLAGQVFVRRSFCCWLSARRKKAVKSFS